MKLIASFKPKIKLFVQGRQRTYEILENHIDKDNKTIWMHAASLGEYEQGLPLLEELKKNFPTHKIVLSFFSPSGYEIKKDKTPADVVVYLPMDTAKNAKKFISLVKPELAIFIKYEIWPNYLKQLEHQKINAILVSAIFSDRQIYFKSYGFFVRKALKKFQHFFVQDDHSIKLLESIGFNNVTLSGDTRFDRVSQIAENENQLDFMIEFKGQSTCVVAGSTWPEDEQVLINYFNNYTENIKFVIAPHNIKPNQIRKLKESITKNVVLYSEMDATSLKEAQIIIIDIIGLLTKIYSYADIAYVGGGFATGLHNTLEPAVFGIPVIIGPNFNGFKEAEDLVKLHGVISIANKIEFREQITKLIDDTAYCQKTGQINTSYIKNKIGATKHVINYITQLF
ncbi:3-deoxy-D-manno-octulosonic acid transferase [Croceitalea vernalis]|uniref:3-deoxy-D-manno-octulosonic acid transferase n=1 Tax=Croceitalea vernalis TaxID=3075599 RepID=A0ABU3BFK3_9FLAO|nr:glycosyltransferase N-terminal domain-containing protein [Croceitalea sp. P007]MDT0620942.1 glycosyltransferase N-terminal domain-containing protein [Croceitalea sp. P007]